jgi:hypothetical protein
LKRVPNVFCLNLCVHIIVYRKSSSCPQKKRLVDHHMDPHRKHRIQSSNPFNFCWLSLIPAIFMSFQVPTSVKNREIIGQTNYKPIDYSTKHHLFITSSTKYLSLWIYRYHFWLVVCLKSQKSHNHRSSHIQWLIECTPSDPNYKKKFIF